MPQLDVSFILDDPMLADCFNVRRRLNVVRSDGRVTAEADTYFMNETGVITQDGNADIDRTQDYQTQVRRISITSRFQFITLAEGQQPDEVEWSGAIWTIRSALPYSRYGEGFHEATAEFREAIQPREAA